MRKERERRAPSRGQAFSPASLPLCGRQGMKLYEDEQSLYVSFLGTIVCLLFPSKAVALAMSDVDS